jgi:hypothetical protein
MGISETALRDLDAVMSARTSTGIPDRICEENERAIAWTLATLNSDTRSGPAIKSALRKKLIIEEKNLLDFLSIVEGTGTFEKAATLARKVATAGKGFFLKREHASEILRRRPPEHVLQYLKVPDVATMLKTHDVSEVFAALRFMETEEWMHETFKEAYSQFTPADFEEREIEIRVLGPAWEEVAKQFVAHKHHNVSHLKEFGIIFINPIREDVPGKFLRDFALLLHYCHEIEFYAKLFRRAAAGPDFPAKLASYLRGDVPQVPTELKPGQWLIVQRYLWKENPSDPRLFLPHVNPESMHWSRGERDLAHFVAPQFTSDLKLWNDLDWVSGIFMNGKEELVSFDLEDNAMSLVSFMEGKNESFNYHQTEALWTKFFMEYAGGEAEMERLLIENFDRGVVQF